MNTKSLRAVFTLLLSVIVVLTSSCASSGDRDRKSATLFAKKTTGSDFQSEKAKVLNPVGKVLDRLNPANWGKRKSKGEVASKALTTKTAEVVKTQVPTSTTVTVKKARPVIEGSLFPQNARQSTADNVETPLAVNRLPKVESHSFGEPRPTATEIALAGLSEIKPADAQSEAVGQESVPPELLEKFDSDWGFTPEDEYEVAEAGISSEVSTEESADDVTSSSGTPKGESIYVDPSETGIIDPPPPTQYEIEQAAKSAEAKPSPTNATADKGREIAQLKPEDFQFVGPLPLSPEEVAAAYSAKLAETEAKIVEYAKRFTEAEKKSQLTNSLPPLPPVKPDALANLPLPKVDYDYYDDYQYEDTGISLEAFTEWLRDMVKNHMLALICTTFAVILVVTTLLTILKIGQPRLFTWCWFRSGINRLIKRSSKPDVRDSEPPDSLPARQVEDLETLLKRTRAPEPPIKVGSSGESEFARPQSQSQANTVVLTARGSASPNREQVTMT